MGLDVYLHHCNNWPAAIDTQERFDGEIEELYTEIYRKYEIPEGESIYSEAYPVALAEFKARQQEIQERYNSETDTENPVIMTSIEENDPVYPDHYYKIGYFRSSYNSSGLNHVVGDRIGVDLYGIFSSMVDDIGGYSSVDWNDSLEKARAALDMFTNYLDKEIGKYDVYEITARNMFWDKDQRVDDNGNVKWAASKAEALQIWEKELGKDRGIDLLASHSYSGGCLDVFPKGITVQAFIKGETIFKEPCVFAVTKTSEEDTDGLLWYKRALEIVVRTCEYVVSQPDPENYRFVWSS